MSFLNWCPITQPKTKFKEVNHVDLNEYKIRSIFTNCQPLFLIFLGHRKDSPCSNIKIAFALGKHFLFKIFPFLFTLTL
jgi:hypothetical protein